MSVTRVDQDVDTLTLTLVAEFDAPLQQVWELWSDPRLLEQWWGPPTYPATVEQHELVTGGAITYFMTGPEGDRHHGYWRMTAVDAGKSLEFTDGFANPDGTPNAELPTTTIRMVLTEQGGRTTMELFSTFGSREQMEQMVEMGMAEGIREAVGQMDALLAA